jgi:8-oxo-dGTP pyrophosphatase MutT (NUDIX family)
MGRVEYLNDPEAPRPNSLVPAAGVLAVDQAGRLLLQRRRDTGQWAIPMGKQELGETVAQCAVRETLEETGVAVEVTGLLGIYSDPGHSRSRRTPPPRRPAPRDAHRVRQHQQDSQDDHKSRQHRRRETARPARRLHAVER